MLILDLIVSAITVAVVAAGAIMALLVNYFKPPADFMETVNQSFLPIDRDALQLLFEARPERVEFMALGRERVSVKEFDFMLAVVDQPYDDAPQNVEFKCPAVQVDRYLWRMDELPVAHLDIVFSPLYCTVGLRRPYLRYSSDRFWTGGGVVDIVGWQTFPISDDRAVVRWILKDDLPKPAMRLYRASRLPGGSNYDWNNVKEVFLLEWGSEMMHRRDVLAQEGLFMTTFSGDDSICEGLLFCNSFMVNTTITIDMVESWDPKFECCLEGIEFIGRTPARWRHGKVTGMPIVTPIYHGMKNTTRRYEKPKFYVARGYLNEVKFDRRISNQGVIQYYKIFTAAGAAEEMQEGDAKTRSETRLYARYSAKKFFLLWFRYTGLDSGWQLAYDSRT